MGRSSRDRAGPYAGIIDAEKAPTEPTFGTSYKAASVVMFRCKFIVTHIHILFIHAKLSVNAN